MATIRPCRHGCRRGFSLAELLVVIAIVGLLVSLCTYGAWRAHMRVRQKAIMTEIGIMAGALEAVRESRSGGYPPCMHAIAYNTVGAVNGGGSEPKTPPDGASYSSRNVYLQIYLLQGYTDKYVNSASLRGYVPAPGLPPHHQFLPGDPTHARPSPGAVPVPLDMDTLDAAEALVFWLGGFPTPYINGQYIASQKLIGFSRDRFNPYKIAPYPGPNTPLPQWLEGRTQPLFDFDESRLVDYDNDGWWEYLPEPYDPSDPPPPYVYFDAGLYREWTNPNLQSNMTAYPPPAGLIPTMRGWSHPEWGVAMPLAKSALSDQGPITWVNDRSFQIICAGFDRKYSNPLPAPAPSGEINARLRFYQPDRNYARSVPNAEPLDDAALDNISNFADQTWGDDFGL